MGLKVHDDAINTTFANIAVGHVSIKFGWMTFAGSNFIMLSLAPEVGLPNLRIFDGSKSSIVDRRISNHRTLSNIES